MKLINSDFPKDYQWQRKFLSEIKQILGLHLIGEAPFEEDAQRNTDLIVLKMEAIRIACRIRRYEFLERYHNEFTFRSERPSGVKTELTKVIEGWGNYFFYGFSNKDETELQQWILGDLNAFRIWFSRELVRKYGKMPGEEEENKDGSSKFRAFKVNCVTGFIFAKKDQSTQNDQF